jgi:hypothetical protein
MGKLSWSSPVLWVMLLLWGSGADAQEGAHAYARCNLKVLEGNEITWINWQAAPTFIPVGTKFLVTRTGSKASLVTVDTQTPYTLDIGAEGEGLLEKFVSTHPVDIGRFPEEIQDNIRKAVAKVGMTKEQVYIAMGPPTNVGKSRTRELRYEKILESDLWIYARRRLGKNIGVAFDPASGRVSRTEGIWGKE